MTDTLNRTVYGRIFRGTCDQISDTGPWDLIGAVFDKTNMPALVIAPGKSIYYDYSIAQADSVTLGLPEDYSTADRIYVAIRSNLKARLTLSIPNEGSGLITLLNGTDSDDDGDHGAFWSYQGRLSSIAVSIPSTADGGFTTSVQIFMYSIPDLDDFESYYDKQIGLGVSGDD